jgi:hypothetical protein
MVLGPKFISLLADHLFKQGHREWARPIQLVGPPAQCHNRLLIGSTTLETIASSFGHPLISLTVADVGIDDESIEEELGKWMYLAEAWGAILLIDEAEVFLERRAKSDLKRNGLVSGEYPRHIG